MSSSFSSAHGFQRNPVIRVFDCHVARPHGDGFEFLLLRRAKGKVYAGDWRMVGGKLEGDERVWEGCLRELDEETGLSVERLLVVPYVNRFYEWQHDRINDIPVFLALVARGAQPRLDDEHVDAVWLSAGSAAARLVWPGQRDGLGAAHALLTRDTALQRHMEIAIST